MFLLQALLDFLVVVSALFAGGLLGRNDKPGIEPPAPFRFLTLTCVTLFAASQAISFIS